MQTALKKDRLFFFDNLRVFLTLLVIFHHVAVTYGAGGSWYYLEPSQNNTLNSILGHFTGLNQLFFMSLFFLISGYFTPGAFDRKGAKSFLKDRLLRLGIPLVVFFFTISPVIEYVKSVTMYNDSHSFWEFYKFNILEKFNLCPGPLWFVETLLVFSVIYLFLRLIFRKGMNSFNVCQNILSSKKILIFILFLSVFTFAGRTIFPAGIEYFHLQFGYYPHYISMFIVGIVAYRRNWINSLTDRLGKLWISSTVIVLVFVSLVLEPLLYSMFNTNDELIHGGLSWQSLLHSSFESFCCVGMCIGLLYLFRRACNSQRSSFSKMLSQNAYTVYIIHAPIVVLMALLMKSISLPALEKFFIVSITGSIVCFLLSHFIFRKIPFANKVL